MANILLIHGAWHGGWCWQKLSDVLIDRGHNVAAPDMPGHGSDNTPTAEVNLDSYTQRIVHQLEEFDEPAVLVGHSMGGVLISCAAEAVPDQVRKLIYLTAFVPCDGEDMLSASAAIQLSSELNANIKIGTDGISTTVASAAIKPCFYHDCDAEDIAYAKSRLVPQPLAPMSDKPSLTAECFGSVPKAYIECVQDAAIPLDAQRKMIARANTSAVVSLDTSHSPFFSSPVQLADAIETLI